MFTTVMYGFINEVTRQPTCAKLPAPRDREAAKSTPNPGRRARRPVTPLAGQYQVLAESFKRAAGFC